MLAMLIPIDLIDKLLVLQLEFFKIYFSSIRFHRFWNKLLFF